MIGCQKCDITEDEGEGLRILPYLKNFPDSGWDWLALCRPCLEDEVVGRELLGPIKGHLPLATPTWEECSRPRDWHRRSLGEKA